MPPILPAARLRPLGHSRCKQAATIWQACNLGEAAYFPPMMIYGRPVRNPRLFLVGALVAAGLVLPFLGAIA
jgi:hypothetical protein